jgi:hypothetical protein
MLWQRMMARIKRIGNYNAYHATVKLTGEKWDMQEMRYTSEDYKQSYKDALMLTCPFYVFSFEKDFVTLSNWR